MFMNNSLEYPAFPRFVNHLKTIFIKHIPWDPSKDVNLVKSFWSAITNNYIYIIYRSKSFNIIFYYCEDLIYEFYRLKDDCYSLFFKFVLFHECINKSFYCIMYIV